jgi:hypothetical protein
MRNCAIIRPLHLELETAMFGVLTLVRLVRRDVVADDYLRGISEMRRYFAHRNTGIVNYLFKLSW